MAGQRDIIDPNKLYPDVLRFMENTVISFLQAIFGAFPANTNPRSYHYDENPDLTEIDVRGASADNLATADTRPIIVVSRGPVTWNNSGINAGLVGSQNLSVARRKYADINSGSIGISCFAREDLEADRLAQICFDSIRMFQTVLQKYGFLTIRAAQIGQRAIVKSDARPELSVTPVLLQTQITRSWTIEVVDPVKLREIIIQVATGQNSSPR